MERSTIRDSVVTLLCRLEQQVVILFLQLPDWLGKTDSPIKWIPREKQAERGINRWVLYSSEVKKDGIYIYVPKYTYACMARLCCALLCSLNKTECAALNCFDFSSPFVSVHFTLRCVKTQQSATFCNRKLSTLI